MGALPPDKAGAGSAVNDTTRELGGTLGVAIVGSMLNSAYGAHVLSGLVALGASASAGRAAGQSVIAGVNVAARFPAPLRAAANEVVSSAFVAGLHRGSLVAAGAAAAGALVALLFVPAHATADDNPSVAGTDAADSARSITPVEA
jgi:DHA2 family multidrug resistance protein-like MFS transporter